MIKHELNGVVPFNDVYYINCFYLAYFTAVRYLNGSILSYAANDYFLYELEETPMGMSLNIVKKSAVPIHDIDKSNCINVEERYNYCPDIIDYIKDAILNNSVIVASVDGFYYKHPYHELFFSKEHHNNVLLIYGFDSEREVFKTTDTNGFQWNTRDCHYKHEISFNDLVICHEGVVNYLQGNPPFPTIRKLSRNSSEKIINKNQRSCKSALISNLKVHKNDIIKGLKNICILADNIQQFNISETASFNNLVASASFQYTVKNVLGIEGDYNKTLDYIVEMWKTIVNILRKYRFNGTEYDKNIFNYYLHQLYKLENLLYEDLFLRFDTI